MKRWTSLLLAALLLITCAGSAMASEVFSEDPTHVITYDKYTQWPVVPEGETVEISVMIPRNDTYGIDYQDMWLWNFLPEVTGITFKVEQISDAAKTERRNLALASNELPDIMWGMGLGTSDLITYGDSEKMLLDMTPYLNADVMPNLIKLSDEFFPTLLADCTTPSGAVYSLPRIEPSNPGGSMCTFINLDYMEAAGVTEVPTTLDDFVDMLYGMKSAYPDSIPLGGSWKDGNPMKYLLKAFGFNSDTNGLGVAIRNGEAVIPAYDEVFEEALKLMNQFYNDEIITKDFFTQDGITNKAQISEGKVGVMPYSLLSVYSDADHDKYVRWESTTAMTSQWNDTPRQYRATPVRIGNFVVSAETKHAETIMRFADAFFAHEATIYLHWGPEWGAGEDMGMIGGWAIEDWNVQYLTKEGLDYSSVNAYLYEVTGVMAQYMGNGAFSTEHPGATPKQYKFYCFGDDITHPQYDEWSVNGWNCLRMEVYMTPYEQPGYPTITFYDEDTAYELAELTTILQPYMESEIAKFITGQRPLDEFDDYRAELASMGMDDLLKIYQDYWASYNAG